VNQLLAEAIEGMSAVKYLDPINQFCDKDRCRGYGKNGALYTDYSHVNNAGVEKIHESGRNLFHWVFQGISNDN